MKLKLTPEGHAFVQDGKPVYVTDAGGDLAFDAVGTSATITRLNGESKGHRERAEGFDARLKLFDGLDAEASRKALDTVKNFDEKQRIAGSERDTAVAAAVRGIEEKYAPVTAERDKLRSDLHGEKIGGAFARSKLIAEKFAIPADLVQARFGHQFKIEDGQVVVFDASGNKLYSKSSPGNPAGFEEGLAMLIESYPHRDSILKGSGASGGGAQQSNAVNGGSQTMTRAQFAALTPSGQAAAGMKAGRGELTITN